MFVATRSGTADSRLNNTYQFSNARGAKRICRGDDALGDDRRDPANRSHRPVIDKRSKGVLHYTFRTSEPPHEKEQEVERVSLKGRGDAFLLFEYNFIDGLNY